MTGPVKRATPPKRFHRIVVHAQFNKSIPAKRAAHALALCMSHPSFTRVPYMTDDLKVEKVATKEGERVIAAAIRDHGDHQRMKAIHELASKAAKGGIPYEDAIRRIQALAGGEAPC